MMARLTLSLRGLAVAIMLAFALSGCASLQSQLNACAVEGNTLYLQGPTSEEMLGCVRAEVSPKINRVVVDSGGGLVFYAMQIGDILAPLKAEFVVDGQCSSSCSNYFLPVARSVRLEPGTQILIHGSIDSNHLHYWHTSRGKPVPSQGQREFDMQRAFVARHRVHPGWLLVRSPEDFAQHRLGPFVETRTDTSTDPVSMDPSWLLLLVDEAFMRSCLTNVEISPFRETLANSAASDPSVRERLKQQHKFLTDEVRCTAPGLKEDWRLY